jgi:serine protease inhibitor
MRRYLLLLFVCAATLAVPTQIQDKSNTDDAAIIEVVRTNTDEVIDDLNLDTTTSSPTADVEESVVAVVPDDHSCFTGDHEDQDTLEFLAAPNSGISQEVIHQAERDFSVNLIKGLFKKFENEKIVENIFLSPSSIYKTLLLAYIGANGKTKDELEVGLGLQNLTKPEILKAFMMDLAYQAVREKTPGLGYEYKDASRLYFDQSIQMNDCLKFALNTQMSSVNFQGEPEATRLGMNQWVEDLTSGRIKDLIPSGYIDSSTKASIVNAAYFKGQWLSQFKTSDTKAGNFYVTRDEIRIVKFMSQQGSFNYYASQELQAHVLELPYEGDHVSMLIILPPWLDDGLQQTVKRMTPATMQGVLAEINSGFYKSEKLDVKIPKFAVSGTLELSQELDKLGMGAVFSADGNFTGFLSPAETAEVKFKKAVHKSFIEVNEEGSEAAAATALLSFRSARPLFETEFRADHPFLFLIYDKQTNTILFFGVYQYPPTP